MNGLSDGLHVHATEFTALNNSGVDGYVLLFANGKNQTLTAHIRAEGLEPDQVHAQRIRSFADGADFKSPTIAQDDDRDGFVELAEGQDTYGPVQLNLTTEPGDPEQFTGTMGTTFPKADADGKLGHIETFRPGASDPDQKPEEGLRMVSPRSRPRRSCCTG